MRRCSARMVFSNKVIDRERIVGVGEQPIDAAAVYEVNADGMIASAWFFNANLTHHALRQHRVAPCHRRRAR